MSYIYLASPYTTRDSFILHQRYRAALRATGALMARGELVFCPVAYGHSVEDKLKQEFPYDYWMKMSLNMLIGASKLYILTIPGWDESKGIEVEIRFAHQLGKPVVGFAHGQEAEDICGMDILGKYGLSLPQTRRAVPHIPENGDD